MKHYKEFLYESINNEFDQMKKELKDIKKIATDAEDKAADAEDKAADAEDKAADAEDKATDAEDKAKETAKSITDEKTFKDYAKHKFEKVFGDNLDTDKMNNIVNNILDKYKEDVEKNNWGKLVGVLNKSFGHH